MSIKKILIKNTGFNLAGYFYLLAASFFSLSILLNNLGRDVFGVYLFMVSFIALSAVFDFGISTAVVRRLSLPQTTPEERVIVWKTSFAIFSVLALFLSLGVFALLSYLSSTMPIFSHIDRTTALMSTFVLAVIIFVNHLNAHFLGLPQAQQRFEIYNSKTLFVGSANTLISAGVSYLYPNIALLFLVQLLFHIFTLIFMILYSRKFFPGSDFYPQYDHPMGRELFSFGIRNFFGTLAGQAENQLSNFILGAMGSARAITSFSIPQSIVIKGAGIVSQFAQAFFPMSTSFLQKDRIRSLRSLVLGVEGLTLLGGFLAIFLSFTIGDDFLLLWLRDSIVVEAAYPILKVMSIYFLFISLTPVPGALLQGLNKPHIPSFCGALTVSLELIFSLFLIRMGAIGVAYAYLASVVITVPLILILTWRHLQLEIARLDSEKNLPNL